MVLEADLKIMCLCWGVLARGSHKRGTGDANIVVAIKVSIIIYSIFFSTALSSASLRIVLGVSSEVSLPSCPPCHGQIQVI